MPRNPGSQAPESESHHHSFMRAVLAASVILGGVYVAENGVPADVMQLIHGDKAGVYVADPSTQLAPTAQNQSPTSTEAPAVKPAKAVKLPTVTTLPRSTTTTLVPKSTLPTSVAQPKTLAAPAPTQPRAGAFCNYAEGPFTTSGNKIMDAEHQRFIVDAITVYGLSMWNYQQHLVGDIRQINATEYDWCANTVRIQASPDSLFSGSPNDTHVNKPYLNDIVTEVNTAKADHLDVILTAQTEHTKDIKNPTEQTLKYWNVITDKFNGPNMMYDLFNEPRLLDNIPHHADQATLDTWKLWQRGGTLGGDTYVGMQELVNQIRRDGHDNLLLVEGPYGGSTLSNEPEFPIKGDNIVDTIHHPLGLHDVASWNKDFGDVGIHLPVIDDEFNQSTQGNYSCWGDAFTTLIPYLKYLHSRGIGLGLWALQPGVLVKGWALNKPTLMTSNWKCGSNQGDGGGAVFDQYFHQHARKTLDLVATAG